MRHRNLFGGTPKGGEAVLSVGLGMLLGGLAPVAARRLIKPDAADPTWRTHVRAHANAYGLLLTAAASGVLAAFKKTRGLAVNTAIIGSAVALPKIVEDYTTDYEGLFGALRAASTGNALAGVQGLNRALGVVTVEKLMGAPVRIMGGRGGNLGAYTMQRLGQPSRPRVRVMGTGSFGSNPIAMAH